MITKIFTSWAPDINASKGTEGLPDGFIYKELYWNKDRTELTIIAADVQWTTHAAFFVGPTWIKKP